MRQGWAMALLTSLAACGGGGESDHDAGADAADDAALDAPTDGGPAVRQPATVRATRRAGSVANLPVLAHDDAGTLVAQTTTDASGNATVLVPAGGLLTVVDQGVVDDIIDVYTVGGVDSGEAISFELENADTGGTTIGTATLTIPAHGTAFNYQIDAACYITSVASGTAAVVATIDTQCLDANENFHVLSKAVNTSITPIAWSVLADQPKTTTAATLPAWSTVFESVTLTVSGLSQPAVAAQLQMELVIGGRPRFWDFDTGGTAGTSPSMTMNVAPGAGTAREWWGRLILPVAGATERAFYVRASTPASTTNVALDLGGMPAISGLALAVTPSPRVTYTLDGPAGASDALVIYASASGGDRFVRWFAILPPTAPSPYVLPTLPGTLDVTALGPGDTGSPQAMLINAEGIGSPAALRANAALWARRAQAGPELAAPPHRLGISGAFLD